jgi:hypothetical protein
VTRTRLSGALVVGAVGVPDRSQLFCQAHYYPANGAIAVLIY